jgi:hypothetical protein
MKLPLTIPLGSVIVFMPRTSGITPGIDEQSRMTARITQAMEMALSAGLLLVSFTETSK